MKISSPNNGFTLVELLVVISIIGILAAIGLVAFTSAQQRGHDAQRKSDLKEMSHALELFYSDYNKYPPDSTGQIQACSYDPTHGTGGTCGWGSGSFTDGNTIYFKVLPKDPVTNMNYYYRLVPSLNGQAYQLFAHLENTQDVNCLNKNCTNPPVPSGVSCGEKCNFSITSQNTTPAAN